MKKEFLLTIATGLLYSSTALAQTCTTPPSCETLGFTDTETDCAGGKMLKCPFDQSKVFCAGNAATNAKPGDIYYSDGTFSSAVIADKIPVGIVAYVYGDSGFVVALEETMKKWSTRESDLSCIPNYIIQTYRPEELLISPETDFNGQKNTSCLLYPITHSYPAAEYCHDLKVVAKGKGSAYWYLPSVGELNFIKHNLETINNSLANLSKQAISIDYYDSTYWSSSEKNGQKAWGVSINYSHGLNLLTKTEKAKVRCILAF